MKLKGEKPMVLSTKVLNNEQESALCADGIQLFQKDFVIYTLHYDKEEFSRRLNDPATQARVFTSKASVRSLIDLLDSTRLDLNPKKTFTVGIQVTEMLRNLGIDVAAKSTNAISLAQIIARNADVKAIDFFCGTQTLNDLPEYLITKGISVNRTEVFNIGMKPESVSLMAADALLFFTPSAVYSFFSCNQPAESVPVFCIGETTAEAVHYRCDNPKILADEPTDDSVIAKVLEFFSPQA